MSKPLSFTEQALLKQCEHLATRAQYRFVQCVRRINAPLHLSKARTHRSKISACQIFPLVADILYWLIQRYDPLVHIPENIETENARVQFLVAVSTTMAAKARIQLKTRSLYAADGRAVKEFLKIAKTLQT